MPTAILTACVDDDVNGNEATLGRILFAANPANPKLPTTGLLARTRGFTCTRGILESFRSQGSSRMRCFKVGPAHPQAMNDEYSADLTITGKIRRKFCCVKPRRLVALVPELKRKKYLRLALHKRPLTLDLRLELPLGICCS